MKRHVSPLHSNYLDVRKDAGHKGSNKDKRRSKSQIYSSYDEARDNDHHTFPEIDQITNKIYLGNYEAARFKDMLKIRGITHVLVIGKELDPLFTEDFEYLIIPVRDCTHERLDLYFKQCFDFIERAKKVFIHCRLGVSRSATVTVAYLMWKHKLKLAQCLKYVEDRRSHICPNEGFIKQLKHLEENLSVRDSKANMYSNNYHKYSR